MHSVVEFYQAIHHKFPDISKKTDLLFMNDWGKFLPEYAYSWFEKLAYALNSEMNNRVSFLVYKPLFYFFNAILQNANDEINTCIDVAFTENLFWQLPEDKSGQYWIDLPESIKCLYLAFHGRPPI